MFYKTNYTQLDLKAHYQPNTEYHFFQMCIFLLQNRRIVLTLDFVRLYIHHIFAKLDFNAGYNSRYNPYALSYASI